jgi:MFS family permease
LLDSLWALLAVMVVAGAGIGIGSPMTMVLAVEGADAHTRGLGLGIRQTANRVADFVSPAVYGAVAAAVGVTSTFFIAAGFALGGLLAAVRIDRRRRVALRLPVAEPQCGTTPSGR